MDFITDDHIFYCKCIQLEYGYHPDDAGWWITITPPPNGTSRDNPHAKIIFVIREPVARMYSMFRFTANFEQSW